MPNWTVKRLGDISDSCLGKMLDKVKNKGSYQPYLANLNVQWGEFKLNSLQEMRFEDHEEERYGLNDGDLVICEGGEPGRCAVWRNEVGTMKVQKALHRLRVHSNYDSDFLYYRMLLAGKRKELDRHFIGSTIKHLTGIGLKGVEFEFPPLNQQQSLSKILRALDKKIELNNKINTELEAMAKLIYDYWFVQLDFPDANGKPYKSSGGKMVYNEELKREIPDGWSSGTLADLGEIVGGSTPSTKNASNFALKGTPWITPKDLSLNVGNKFISRGGQDVSDEGVKSASLKLYPKGTVLMSSRAPIGYMAIAREELTTNQGFKSFIPNKGFSSDFIFYTVNNSMKIIEQYSSGSTFKEISGSVLKTVKICLPTTGIAGLYSKKVGSVFKRQILLEIENTELSKLRDWLLPMLMNGQVKISFCSVS